MDQDHGDRTRGMARRPGMANSSGDAGVGVVEAGLGGVNCCPGATLRMHEIGSRRMLPMSDNVNGTIF